MKKQGLLCTYVHIFRISIFKHTFQLFILYANLSITHTVNPSTLEFVQSKDCVWWDCWAKAEYSMVCNLESQNLLTLSHTKIVRVFKFGKKKNMNNKIWKRMACERAPFAQFCAEFWYYLNHFHVSYFHTIVYTKGNIFIVYREKPFWITIPIWIKWNSIVFCHEQLL